MRLLLPLFLLVTFQVIVNEQRAPDLVLVNGKVWTVNQRQPEAEAVACKDGRILDVGTSEQIRRMIGPKTRVSICREGVSSDSTSHVPSDGGRGSPGARVIAE